MDVYVRGEKHQRFSARINGDLSCLQIKGKAFLEVVFSNLLGETQKVSILTETQTPPSFKKKVAGINQKVHY